MIIQEIPQWMGSLTQVKVQGVSLQEAKEILAGLNCLEKGDPEEVTGPAVRDAVGQYPVSYS